MSTDLLLTKESRHKAWFESEANRHQTQSQSFDYSSQGQHFQKKQSARTWKIPFFSHKEKKVQKIWIMLKVHQYRIDGKTFLLSRSSSKVHFSKMASFVSSRCHWPPSELNWLFFQQHQGLSFGKKRREVHWDEETVCRYFATDHGASLPPHLRRLSCIFQEFI